ADAIFDNDRLTKLSGELIEDHARRHVGAAACRIRHNCADWPGWPRLCAGLGAWYREDENRKQRQANPFHGFPSALVFLLTSSPASRTAERTPQADHRTND